MSQLRPLHDRVVLRPIDAGLIVTTEALIADKPEKKPQPAPQGGELDY